MKKRGPLRPQKSRRGMRLFRMLGGPRTSLGDVATRMHAPWSSDQGVVLEAFWEWQRKGRTPQTGKQSGDAQTR